MANDGGWCEFYKRAAAMGLPQLPDEAIVSNYARLIDGKDQRVLLLGITRALAHLGKDLTAIDYSAAQIEKMWQGDSSNRRAVHGAWRDMSPPRLRYTAAIGDGSLATLATPDEYRNVLARVAQMLVPDGVIVLRCFIAPDKPETLEEIANDVFSGREREWNAARWRVAMAAVDADGGITTSHLAASWRRLFPDTKALAERTGWNAENMELIMHSYSRASLRYSFLTRAAVLETLPSSLANVRFEQSGNYPLAERCPFLVAERKP